MSELLVISIDCSTTSSKAIVWNSDGVALAEARMEIPLSIPNDGWGEQDPELWWSATKHSLTQVAKKIDANKIAALVLTHQRESFACLNENGKAIRPAMLWLDTRAHAQVKQFGTGEVHTITGKPANPTPAFFKLLWLKENEPDVLLRTKKIVDVHSYLSSRLADIYVAPTASVDPLGLTDIKTGRYSPALMKTLGILEQQLPSVCQPGDVVAALSDSVATSLGLPAGVKLVAGGGDGQCAGLGAGAAEPGIGYLNLGTGLIAGVYSEEYRASFAYRTMMGTIPGSYNYEFFVGAGTYLVNWFKSHQDLGDLQGKSPEQFWGELAAEVPIGSQGLFTLPYWNGALTPYWDQNARGSIIGFTGIHQNQHLYRSILEGIAFELRLCLESAAATLRHPLTQLIAMGGGVKSELWCQILADNLKIPITISHSQESTSLGAAMLGFAAIGSYQNTREAAQKMSGTGKTYQPNLENSQEYDRYYEVYRGLFPALKSSFAAIGELW